MVIMVTLQFFQQKHLQVVDMVEIVTLHQTWAQEALVVAEVEEDLVQKVLVILLL
tara:strand:+ start:83 stop:247 length:165 start_codon:yes stop_codon:yes gene_type:complete